MSEQPSTDAPSEQPSSDTPTRGKRALMRYGGIAMFLGGLPLSLAVPAVGVPMIVFGVIFFFIGLVEPARK